MTKRLSVFGAALAALILALSITPVSASWDEASEHVAWPTLMSLAECDEKVRGMAASSASPTSSR